MPDGPPLFQHHVFVDLETTGLDPARDEVIELGALFVQDGQVVRRLSRLFRPGAPLPLAIRRLTGLKDEDLAGQPPFSDFAAELEEALDGWTVVAHNAGFERSFLDAVFRRVDAELIDSCELLHYLYPEWDSHSLETVVRWAKVADRAAHRAMQDCEDTHAALKVALGKVVADGRGDDVEELLDCLSPRGRDDAPVAALLRALGEQCRASVGVLTLTADSPFLPSRADRLRRLDAPRGNPEADPAPVAASEVDAVLGAGGALERLGEGFGSREGQRELGRRVARTLSQGGRLAMEAGTGTGKSLAYLAPSALWAVKNGRKVGVAPHTRALQDQLMEKDLPRLHRALDGGFGYALLKGQTNYACRRRALEATAVDGRMRWEERAPRAYFRAFLRRSPDGDLDRLSWWFREHFPALGALVAASRSEAAATLGEQCPHYRRCFYHSAVAQAKAADVLVINQALALAWPQRYPKLDHLVLDEAHELEDVLTTALSTELSDAVFNRVGERLLGREGRRGLLAELRRVLAGKGLGQRSQALVAELEDAVRAVGEEALRLGVAVEALCAEGSRGRYAHADEKRITDRVRAQPAWEDVTLALGGLREALAELEKKLVPGVGEACPSLSLREPAMDRELTSAVAELKEAYQLVGELAGKPRDDRCYAASVRPDGRGWTLSSLPLDVRRTFDEALGAEGRSLILSSATLSTGPDRPWILERLGLSGNAEGAAEWVQAGTPFDLRRQTLVVLVTDAPDPQEDAFLDWAAERISGLGEFMGGRVLGLFASSRRLEEVGERVRARLEPQGIEVLRQSRGNGRLLAARQEKDHGSVLLGTRTFWQGIDIPGLGVACVFIDKLPIEPQSRPIVEAREEAMGKESYQGFLSYRLPRALLQLRQGVGRLVRSPADRGVVIVADPGSPRYRAQVVAALEGYRVEVLPWARARVRLFEALTAFGLDARKRGAQAPLPSAAVAAELPAVVRAGG
jgi:ATP-dependent DNA helicase DinG